MKVLRFFICLLFFFVIGCGNSQTSYTFSDADTDEVVGEEFSPDSSTDEDQDDSLSSEEEEGGEEEEEGVEGEVMEGDDEDDSEKEAEEDDEDEAGFVCDSYEVMDDFIASLAFAGKNSNEFSEPSSTQLTAFNSLVSSLLNDETTNLDSKLSTTGYEIVCLTDSKSETILALRETGNLGGGTYFIHTNPTADIILEAPHPVYEPNTKEEAAYLFQELGARILLVAGTHRCASTTHTTCSGTTSVCGAGVEAYRISDVAHNTNTFFHEAHKTAHNFNSNTVAVSLHGKMAYNPDAIFSDGTTTNRTNALSNDLADDLEVLLGDTVHSCNQLGDPDDLCGSTNVQGRYSNNSSNECTAYASTATDRFIHLEQNLQILFVPSLWDHVLTVFDAYL